MSKGIIYIVKKIIDFVLETVFKLVKLILQPSNNILNFFLILIFHKLTTF